MHELIVFVAAFAAGAVNSVAGGGTLITFPTLIWLGVPSVAANMTNTIALWPGSLGSAWAYRRELRDVRSQVYAMVLPSVVGGAAGAILLARTPAPVFDRLVPALLVFATALFAAQGPLQRRFSVMAADETRSHWLSWAMVFQFLIAVYGGYFGAGLGILMLAAMGVMGRTDIHQMNGVKSLLAVCVNGTAAVYFATSGQVRWWDALVMAIGAVGGGIAAASAARRTSREAVRWVVITMGLVSAAWAMKGWSVN